MLPPIVRSRLNDVPIAKRGARVALSMTATQGVECTMIDRQLLLYGASPDDKDNDSAKIATLLDVLNAPVAYCDVEHRYRYVNEALCSRFRLARNMILGLTYAEIDGRNAFEAQLPTLRRVLAGYQLSEARRVEGARTGTAWWQIEHYPNRNRAGEVVGYYTFLEDITAAKELERAVGERGEQVRRLVESIVMPMARWDRDGKLVFCNSPYEIWVGRPRSEVLGKTVTEIFGAAAWAVAKSSFERAFAGVSVSYERLVYGKAPEPRWHRVHVFPDEVSNASAETVFTIAFDIDDDIRLRQQLAANEARLRSVLESIDLPIARVNPQREITYCNKPFAAYANRERDEIIGRTVGEVFGSSAFAIAESHYERAFANETVTFDHVATHEDPPRWVRTRIVADRDATGVARGVLVTVYDIDADVRARKRLEASAARLDRFTDNIPFPLTFVDRAGAYRFANREFLARHKLRPEQVIGQHVAQSRGDAVWEGFKPFIQSALSGQTTINERLVRLPENRSRWTRTVYSPSRDENGAVEGVYVTSFDVHELKTVQEEIASVHEQLRAHLENSPVVVVAYNGQGEIVQWSPRAQALLGYSSAEMLGRRFTRDFVHPDDRDEIDTVIKRMLKSGSSTIVNTNRYRHRNGHYLWMEWYSTVRWDANGRMQSVFSLGIDAQARMEARLRLQSFANRIPNPIGYLDVTGQYKFLNATFLAWRGLPASELIGRTPREMLSGELGEMVQSMADAALRGQEVSAERITKLSDGSERWIKSVFTPDFDDAGRIVGCYNVSFDVHETKLLQQSLQNAADRDPLTGALTRRAFFSALDQRLQSSEASVVSLFFADLDGFKQVNDRFGHAAGDQVLIEAVRCMSQCAAADDLVARLGGDEIVVVTRASSAVAARAFAEAAIAAISAISIEGAPRLTLSASIGVAMTSCGAGGVSSDELVSRADRAMYEAKRDGGGRLRFANQLST